MVGRWMQATGTVTAVTAVTVVVTVAMGSPMGCAEVPQPAPRIAPSEVPARPTWETQRGDGVTVPSRSAASGPVFMEGVAVAGPVDNGPPGARWQTRTLGGPTESNPVDELLRGHHGERSVGEMHLRDAPVTDTLRMFAEMGGFNLVFSDNVGDRRVTLDLRDVPMAAAFRTVLSAAHLGAEASGADILEVGPALRRQ